MLQLQSSSEVQKENSNQTKRGQTATERDRHVGILVQMILRDPIFEDTHVALASFYNQRNIDHKSKFPNTYLDYRESWKATAIV